MSFSYQEYLRPTHIVNAFAKYFSEVCVYNGNNKFDGISEKICDIVVLVYSDIASDTKNNSICDSPNSGCDSAHVLYYVQNVTK